MRVFVTSLLFWTCVAHAQETPAPAKGSQTLPPAPLTASGDGTHAAPVVANLKKPGKPKRERYFEKFPQLGVARMKLDFPMYGFYLGTPDINGVTYIPNFSPSLGMSVSWKSVGVSASVALPIPSQEVDRRGSSDQRSYIINRYWRQYGLDVYYQRYRGLYLANPFVELDFNKPTRYSQLPDAAIMNYGFNFYYLFDAAHYSMAAAYAQSEKQIKTGGSLLLIPFYNHISLARGGQFIAGSDSSSNQKPPDLNGCNIDTLGMTGGYGHTFAFGGIFINAQAAVGPGLQVQTILQNSGSEKKEYNVGAKFNFSSAVGVNYQNLTFGGQFLVDVLVSNVEGAAMSSYLIDGLLYVGGRF